MRRFLRKVEQEELQYRLGNDRAASIEELKFLLERMSEEEVNEQFHSEGNFFAPWVEQVIGDSELAADLAPLRQKEDVVRALAHRIFMINALTEEGGGVSSVLPEPSSKKSAVAAEKKRLPKRKRASSVTKKKRASGKKRGKAGEEKQSGQVENLKKQASASKKKQSVVKVMSDEFNAYKQELIARILKDADPSLKKRIRSFQRKAK